MFSCLLIITVLWASLHPAKTHMPRSSLSNFQQRQLAWMATVDPCSRRSIDITALVWEAITYIARVDVMAIYESGCMYTCLSAFYEYIVKANLPNVDG